MAKLFSTRWLIPLVAIAVSFAAPAFAHGAPSWERFPLPKVGTFETPLGAPSEIKCWSANRCLFASQGNANFANGLFVFNGASWRQYATVCGRSTDPIYGGVVWAGPTEFWTITTPSPPYQKIAGIALCHFKDGQVVGSYSTIRGALDVSTDPFHLMTSGACATPSDCWFAGEADRTSDGTRAGSFHLHWNGTSLKTVYAPAKRGVSDIIFDGDRFVESSLAGPRPGAPPDETLGTPPPLRLLQQIDPALDAEPSAFSPVDFEPTPVPGLTGDTAELLALDVVDGPGAAKISWAVGGGAASGPDVTAGDPANRGPLVAFRNGTGDWTEITMPAGMFGVDTTLSDVAGIPGTNRALATVMVDGAESTFGSATVAMIDTSGSVTVSDVGFDGSASRVECAAVDDCWLATLAGALYRFRDPAAAALPIDINPAMTTTVTFRPNEVAEQAISDSPPVDDSLLFAPPPDAADQGLAAPPGKPLKPAVRSVRSKLKGRVLILKFRVIRPARLRVVARRKGRVVASAKTRLLKPGKHSVKLRLNVKRWPTRLSMKVTEPGEQQVDDDETVTVPAGGVDKTTEISAACARQAMPQVCKR
ncbi:MAG: hypothetical protein WAP35_10000 [Solirubrobacterales bacterium]